MCDLNDEMRRVLTAELTDNNLGATAKVDGLLSAVESAGFSGSRESTVATYEQILFREVEANCPDLDR